MKQNNNHTPVPPTNLLEEIRLEKINTRIELRACSKRIKEVVDEMFSPPQTKNDAGRILNLIERGIALYDGVCMGMSVIKAFRGMFHKKGK